MGGNNRAFENIWMADDDPDDCEFFEAAINKVVPAVRLTIVSNGDQLLKLFDSHKVPDLLFLDINMPWNGLDCLKEIRDVRGMKKLPIVVFSCSSNLQDMYASYGFGANLYYPKPFSFSELVTGLQQLLQMNWDDPYSIAEDHYINKRFVPFKRKM